jgi:hypothetical protein
MTVNADGTPGHVASGELVASAWGNAVVDSRPVVLGRVYFLRGQVGGGLSTIGTFYNAVTNPIARTVTFSAVIYTNGAAGAGSLELYVRPKAIGSDIMHVRQGFVAGGFDTITLTTQWTVPSSGNLGVDIIGQALTSPAENVELWASAVAT